MQPKLLKSEVAEFKKEKWNGKNESGYRPFGDRVLVLSDEALEVTSGGVHLPQNLVARQSMAAESGVVIAIGEGAWVWNADRSRPFSGEKPKPGDRVCFQRYAGQGVFGQDGKHYRLMDDNAIGAIENE